MSKKLSVLFLCGWYPSRVFPTNGDFIQRHAATVALSHNVTVIHIITDKESTENIIYTTEKNGNLTTHIAYVKKTIFFKKIYLFTKAFKKLVKTITQVDIVHLNEIYPMGIFALFLKSQKKIPFIISEHWTGYLKTNQSTISLLHKTVAKRTIKNAAVVCPVSNELKNDMIEFGLKGNYRVIGNVVNTNLFIPKDKSNSKTFNIIHISNLNDVQKNISGLLNVAKRIEKTTENIKFLLIGGGGNSYKNILNKLNFRKETVTFINHISQKELVTYLQQSDLFVSFSNYETFSIVTMEALSCGVPVISTRTGVITEFDSKPFFKLISTANENELYTAILEYKNSTPFFDKKEMYNLIDERFSQSKILESFSEVYFNAIKLKDE